MTAGKDTHQRRLFWSEVAVAAVLGLTAIGVAWSAYKATLVRDEASSSSTRDVHFDCQKFLTGVEQACD